MSLHDILHLWKIRVLDGGVSDLTSISMERIYPLSSLQTTILLFNPSDVMDYDIWKTIKEAPDARFLTVSRAAATRVNTIVMRRMFEEKTPLSSIPLENDVEEFLPFKHMRVVVTQNLDKRMGVIN